MLPAIRDALLGAVSPVHAEYHRAMPEAQTLVTFAAACVLFAVIPGPAVIYIVTRSVEQGRMAGIASVFGIATGTLVHVPAAALGLSAILVSSATAFTVVKYLGAAYLIYLGVRKILDRDEAFATGDVPRQSLGRIYGQGAIVGVLNPKTALFFLAFLPQFVDPAQGSITLQFIVLGVLLVLISMVSDTCYAMLTGTAGEWLRRRSPSLGRRLAWLSGGIYITLGAGAAISGSRATAVGTK
jgi:threonine/homoserine/homoserine lactone efflux protein